MARVQLYDPFPTDAFEDLVRTFFRPAQSKRGNSRSAYQSFRLDVSEDDKSYTVHAEVPGVAKDDIQVTIDGHQVTIAAEAKREAERKDGARSLHVERHSGSWFRSFTLPTEVDEAASTAKYDNGVLELTLAKRGPQAARKLSIQ
ncbi:MAG TPA: Hsp20/alpha crystallin family protein [Casimicrobiaceae bacterium]|nr:Hsp20/alpha crystallin family protein [Casimicrobiaceae bacterium]